MNCPDKCRDNLLFNVNQLLISLSRTLDFAEKDLLPNHINHGMRVAYISARIAEKINMSDKNRFDLISYALLHDNGVMASMRRLDICGRQTTYNVESDPVHCLEGEKNLAHFPFLSRQKNIILYHHEKYDGSGPFGITGINIPLYSRIISLADYIAIRYSEGKGPDAIKNSIMKDACKFDPDLCEVVFGFSRHIEFWLNQKDEFVYKALISMLPQVKREFNYQKIHQISQIFSRIIDAKSPFTGSHSRGISEKTGFICQFYEFDDVTYWKMRIAADLHDLGKLAIPNSILDKPSGLTRKEFQIIQAHPFYTRRILEKIDGFDDITDWAANHHEKLDGSGYPYGLDKNDLDFNSRILACVDIYQALTEDRPYRKGMSHKDAIKIMNNMAREGLIEPSVTEDMDSIFRDSD